MEKQTECQICAEKFNKTTRRKIPCLSCNLEYCLKCLKQYMKSSEKELDCMSCGVKIPIFYIKDYTPKTFYRNSVRIHNTDILFNVEKSMLPNTIHLVEIEREKERLYEENDKIIKKICSLKREISQLYDKRQINFNKIYYGLDLIPNKDKKEFICPCPVDNCRGFLSTKWKCAICETNVCKHCRNILDEEHKCNPEDIESTKIIFSNTKPCPECGARIMKSEGCDHMFCTNCKTGFSWKSGKKLDDSKNTNPLFYEWMRENGGINRNPDDIICGGLPSIRELEEKMDISIYTKYVSIANIHRCIMHVYHIELEKYNPEQFNDNSDLRVDFLMDRIDEDYWKDILKTRVKKINKYKDIHQTLSLFHQTMVEYMIMLNTHEEENINDIIISIKKFRKYINNHFKNLLEIYNNVMPYINKDWEINTLNTSFHISS